MEPTLEDLLELHRLKKLSGRRRGEPDTTQLEQEFLSFSSQLQRPALTVQIPKQYALEGDELQHFAEALELLGLSGTTQAQVTKAVITVDISGATHLLFPSDVVLFVSAKQLAADHVSTERSYLNPLIEQIYTKGRALLRDFTVHEALVGKVVAKRGGLDLQEVRLFPERFKQGPYELYIELDTPRQTVRQFRSLADVLEETGSDPKSSLLNPARLKQATDLAIGLRERLGSLSRYSPAPQTFTSQTYSCLVRTEEADLFYLYAPLHNKNVLVRFGSSPFNPANKPADLMVLDGSNHQNTLIKLLELGIFQVSPQVLKLRIEDLTKMYEQASRAASISLRGRYPDFEGLMGQLKEAEDTFKRTVNPDARKAYAARISADVLEFMVYPNTEDPVIHELLPRLSWNRALREYHNTRQFVRVFSAATDENKKAMLEEVTASTMFRNQQNNNVNQWLYQQHMGFCEAAGVTFATSG